MASRSRTRPRSSPRQPDRGRVRRSSTLQTPAARYLRSSTSSQTRSIEAQAEIVAAYALLRGYAIVRTYEDVGISGVTLRRRPALRQLISDVQAAPEFRVVLVADVSRWGRFQNPDEAAHLEFICRLQGVRIEYCAELFRDDETLSSAVHKSLRRVMAAEFSRQLAEKTRAGQRRVALAGEWPGTPAPFGFSRCALGEDGLPEQVLEAGERARRWRQPVRVVAGPPGEIATLKGIFDLFVLERFSAGAISRLLNNAGIPYRRGAPWTPGRVLVVLRCELAIGQQVFNRMESRFGVCVPLPEADWLRVKVFDPVVAPALFEAARERLAGGGAPYSNDRLIERLRRHRRRLAQTVGRAAVDLALPLAEADLACEAAITERLALYDNGEGGSRMGTVAGYGRREILTRLRQLYRRHGRLSHEIINAAPDLPRAVTIGRHFGGLRAVYALVGFEPSPESVAEGIRQGRAHARLMDEQRRVRLAKARGAQSE